MGADTGGMDREGALPDRFVSAGRLPPGEAVRRIVEDVHAGLVAEQSGALSQVYPALTAADPGLFGLALVSTGGDVVGAGDVAVPFAVMSIAKPFVFALVAAAHGVEAPTTAGPRTAP